jgi:1-acyl-sn-glycerol-3-phosphate acyltransferase
MTATTSRLAGSLWAPASCCDESCVPQPPAGLGGARRGGRIAASVPVLLVGMVLTRQGTLIARALLRTLGVRWRVAGAPVRPGALVVGNHESWLDIVLVAALSDRIRMVAKHEVRQWPIFGRMASRNGTIFVDRANPRSLPGTIAQVVAALRAGHAVQVFPEGTTSCGEHPARWRPAFFQAAIDAGAPVQRMTIRYESREAAFVGAETLVSSLGRVLSTRRLAVTVHVDPPRQVTTNRKEFARLIAVAA